MGKRLASTVTAFLTLGMAGVANAAVLNWEGTMTSLVGAFPPVERTGGGVATVNASSGVIPAHLNTLRLAPSRGQIGGTVTRLTTDPDILGNGVYALIYSNVRGLTGTWGGISGGAASTTTGGGIMPEGGVVKVCLLSTACTQFIWWVLNQPTTVNRVPGTGTKGVGVGGLITAGGYGGIRLSLKAAPWTIKSATVLDQVTPPGSPPPPREYSTWVAKGWAHGPGSAAGIGHATFTTFPEVSVALLSFPKSQKTYLGRFEALSVERLGGWELQGSFFLGPSRGLLINPRGRSAWVFVILASKCAKCREAGSLSPPCWPSRPRSSWACIVAPGPKRRPVSTSC